MHQSAIRFGARSPLLFNGDSYAQRITGPDGSEPANFIDAGFNAMKIRLGSATIAADVERVSALRAAVGPDIGIYGDANQSLSVKHAIRLGRELEAFDLVWFEEPVVYHDHDGCGRDKAGTGAATSHAPPPVHIDRGAG